MCGVISLGNLKSKILKGKVFGTDTVAKAIYTTYKKVTLDTTLIKLNRILDKEHFALVVHQQRLCKEDTTAAGTPFISIVVCEMSMTTGCPICS